MARIGRGAEALAVSAFLEAARTRPAALVIDGEAGMGKTTQWWAAIHQARRQGYCVLSAQAAQTESVMVYGVLADLLSGVEETLWADDVPSQQAAALRHVTDPGTPGGSDDRRTVATGFLSLIHRLAERMPVIIAIDDAPWADRSSRDALAFAARRLTGPVGVLITERRAPHEPSATGWLQLMHPESMQTVTVHPLSLGRLHAVLSERLGQPFPRPTMVHIAETSAGNPFYALELGRALIASGQRGFPSTLPGTLADLVASRIGTLPAPLHRALLAVSSIGEASVATVARALEIDVDAAVTLLEDAEAHGIVTLEGSRVRFVHPLLARGVYTGAPPAARRAMHRRLAEITEKPELKAQHLALASVVASDDTLELLDSAARSVRARGAPAAAAELLEKALRLGGDTPQRRIRASRHWLAAGDPGQARALVETLIDTLPPGVLRSRAFAQLAAVQLFDDNFIEAARMLQSALTDAGDDPVQRVQVCLNLSFTLFNSGHIDPAIDTIDEAIAIADRLGIPPLLCQALGFKVNMKFFRGDGPDEATLHRALALDGADLVPAPFRPTAHRALLLTWTGQLEEGRDELRAIRQGCLDRGEEAEIIPITFNSFLAELWLGNVADAHAVAEDTMERAEQLGGALAPGIAHTMRAMLAAYAGQEQVARTSAEIALAACRTSGAATLTVYPLSIAGFLELSLQNHLSALSVLEPALALLATAPQATEIVTAPYLPDAAEAMVEAGQLDRAEKLIQHFESHGRRRGRTWALATAARCHSMLSAARGDLDGATRAGEEALRFHDELPMPFERARTELHLGKLQRRRRQRDVAAARIRSSVAAFDEFGAPLWADRARAELARVEAGTGADSVLTSSEQRVARLAAEGKTNREIAGSLFISQKTVEANLARVYRKLGIRSRAQLGRRLSGPDS